MFTILYPVARFNQVVMRKQVICTVTNKKRRFWSRTYCISNHSLLRVQRMYTMTNKWTDKDFGLLERYQ